MIACVYVQTLSSYLGESQDTNILGESLGGGETLGRWKPELSPCNDRTAKEEELGRRQGGIAVV